MDRGQHDMRRREFIALVGGGAVAWPLAARAQQADRMRRVGMLSTLTSDDPEGQARVAAFRDALQKLGWTDGRNLRIAMITSGASATSSVAFLRRCSVSPSDQWTAGNSSIGPLLQATRTVPVIFVTAADPVGAGFVNSL